MSEIWTCPDCAEDVPLSVTVCPYCAYDAASMKAPAAGAVDAGSAAPGRAPATRTVRYGHCPSCGRSEWEGTVAGRCVTCGAKLVSLQVVEVPPAAGSEAQPAVATVAAPRPEVAPAMAAAPKVVAAPARQSASVQPGVARATEATESAGDGPSAATLDAIALLRQLAALRDEGVITNEDFETKKAEILRRL